MIRKIVHVIAAEQPTQLLEVGPGGGAITQHLMHLPGVAFKAVELDREKVDYLEQTFPALSGKLIHQSFLETEPPFADTFMVAGNFPYNISSQILFKILEWRQQVTSVVGMFQKEVAQRVAARSGTKSYGILSVLVQAYYQVEYLFEVHENCFTPPPKVKSAIIRLTPAKEVPPMRSEADFFKLVKTAFNQRRKMLRNSVKDLFAATTLQEDVFTRRPEQLTVVELAALTFKMQPLGVKKDAVI